MLPLCLFFFFYKRNRKTDIRVIFFYCAYTFINDLSVSTLYQSPRSEKNDLLIYGLLSLFTVIEYIVFSTFIYLNLRKGIFKSIILIVSPLFLAFSVFQFFRGLESSIDSPTIAAEYILLMVFCLFYFFKEINQPESVFIYSSYAFWVITAILIYSTGTFFFWSYSGNLSDEDWRKWSIINYIFMIIKNILLGIAVAMPKKTNTLQSQEKHLSDQFFDPPPLNPL